MPCPTRAFLQSASQEKNWMRSPFVAPKLRASLKLWGQILELLFAHHRDVMAADGDPCLIEHASTHRRIGLCQQNFGCTERLGGRIRNHSPLEQAPLGRHEASEDMSNRPTRRS